MKQLLLPTTSATASDEHVGRMDDSNYNIPAHFTCPGIAGAETGTLQKKEFDGTWKDYVINVNEHIISATRSGVVVYAPGTYRINKSATAAAVPVNVSTGISP